MDFRKFTVTSQGDESHKGSENVEVCLFCDDFSYDEHNKSVAEAKKMLTIRAKKTATLTAGIAP